MSVRKNTLSCVKRNIEKQHYYGSQASAVAHGTVNIGHMLSIGKMRFSTTRPGKTNKYFVTKLGRRGNVDKIYKLTKCGEDRLRNGASKWWLNITVL